MPVTAQYFYQITLSIYTIGIKMVVVLLSACHTVTIYCFRKVFYCVEGAHSMS